MIRAIHQFHPGVSGGDGVTRGMLFAQRLLRQLGFRSDIYCEHRLDDFPIEVRPHHELSAAPGQLLLQHHSLGYANSAWLEALDLPRILVYHNITPSHLLPAGSGLAEASVLGRQQLRLWAPACLGAIGDSETNSDELREAGYAQVVTLPMLVDLDALRQAPWHRGEAARWRDQTTLLFVGRICENKRQLQLVDMLHELRALHPGPVRLILAGGTTSGDYLQRIEARIRQLGLGDSVVLAGKVTDARLFALYRNVEAMVCMSEHEGFGMPLIEATAFDLPVVAHAISSIPQTLGEGGLLSPDGSPRAIAERVQALLRDAPLRRQVIARQRRNLQRFEPDHLLHQLADYLASLGVELPQPPPPRVTAAPRPYWQVEGPFDSSYSLAIVNREVGLALARRGHDLGLRSLEGDGDFQPAAAFLREHADCAALSARAGQQQTPPDVALRFCYPPHVDNMPAAVRAVHSYGWEETGFPPAYVAAFNRKLDLITVLSSTVAKILRDNGVRLPIAVTGAGVDHLLDIVPEPPTLALRGFRFLHVSSCFPRKGVDALLWAYGQAFRDHDDVSLIIKTFANPHNEVALQLENFRERDPGYPDVVLIEADWSDAAMAGLYAASDAFVAPSRGEGLGLPLAEAMLFHLPVITTAWGGQTDFCDDTSAWLCDYQFAVAQTHLGLSHSVWAEPDIDHLASLLREVWLLTPQERQRRTRAARARILGEYTWDRVAQRNEAAVAALAQMPVGRAPLQIGWLSTWNKRCGIAGYSHFLTSAFAAAQITIFADRYVERTAEDGPNVCRCWTLGFEENLDELHDEIIARGLDALVIQYNFGFFKLATLARLIERLKQAGVDVHCFFHATGDLIWAGRKISLSEIVPALALADRLYVHTVQDLNRMKRLGLVRNVVLFPQGVLPVPPLPAEQAGDVAGKRVLATYGYLLPHKGLREMIRAFAALAREDQYLHLLMVNAVYPVPESEQEKQACKALITELDLAHRVTLLTDYLTEAECLAQLQCAELIVYPYQQTQESSSAAVRMGLASGRPVVVTPLYIFDDVVEAVQVLPGVEVQDMVRGLRELLADPEALRRQAPRTAAWIAARQWPLLSRRLLDVITGLGEDRKEDRGSRRCAVEQGSGK